MASWQLKCIEDLKDAVSNKTPESLILEYKGSKVLTKSDTGKIAKTVAAFANSVGGQFVLGVEVNSDHEPERLDGGFKGKSKTDWIHQIISAHTYPPVPQVDVLELMDSGGLYYCINVPRSLDAPHQASDNVYYRRRGSLSVPMDHYEIEDIRNRPKYPSAPLRIALETNAGYGALKFENTNSNDDVIDIQCDIDSTVELDSTHCDFLVQNGIRSIQPQRAYHIPIGHVGQMLRENPSASITLKTNYQFRGEIVSEKQELHLDVLSHSIVWKTPIHEALGEIKEEVSKLSRTTEKIVSSLAPLETISDGTGVRLSNVTMKSCKGEEVRLDPFDYDWKGYKIIADLTTEDAIKLRQLFHTMISPEEANSKYEELPSSVRESFESKFEIPFRTDQSANS